MTGLKLSNQGTALMLSALILAKHSMQSLIKSCLLGYILLVFEVLFYYGCNVSLKIELTKVRLACHYLISLNYSAAWFKGSGTGQLMFLVLIKELIAVLESYGIKIKLLADDVKLYSAIIEMADATS